LSVSPLIEPTPEKLTVAQVIRIFPDFYGTWNAYRILVGKPEGKRPLGRPRHRWEDNIKMTVREIGWVVWTGLIWLRIVRSRGLL
jgi:hypothetical protein